MGQERYVAEYSATKAEGELLLRKVSDREALKGTSYPWPRA